jgi:hypothetical protein
VLLAVHYHSSDVQQVALGECGPRRGMTEIPVGKRRFHAFISHAHVDRTQADELYRWLHYVAALPVWYDAVNMPPGAVTALPCILGEYVTGDVVQREILRAVSAAALVIADISGDSPNVYIEIGAAKAANVPVFLLRKGRPGRPAFMLRDQQVWDYSTGPELLARALRIVYPYRRTLVGPSATY